MNCRVNEGLPPRELAWRPVLNEVDAAVAHNTRRCRRERPARAFRVRARRWRDDSAARLQSCHKRCNATWPTLAVLQTINWLDKNGIPYWDLCLLKDKEQVGAYIYVEDNPSIIQHLRRENLYVICFANSTNGQAPPPRVASWREVYELIHAYSDSPGTQGHAPVMR